MRKAGSMENYENQDQGLDLTIFLGDMLRQAKRTLALGIVLVLLCAGGLAAYRNWSFTPVYEAYASFTVRVENPMYSSTHSYNAATAEQMAKTFPYVLGSGVLQERVKKQLGTTFLPSIRAEVMSSSSIFTLRVRDTQPERAHTVLNAVIACYPEVADFVVGPTNMVLLDESGIPAQPVNSLSLSSAVRKGAVAGMGIWLLIVLFLARSRVTIHNDSELKRLLNFRCMGFIPLVRTGGKAACPVLFEGRGHGEFSESVRLLRLRLEKELAEQGKKVILISSAIPDEGKTTTSVNLAASLAMRGRKVLLVDCDLRNPTLDRAMRMKKHKGLAEYITGEISAQELIRPTKVENLHLIGGGMAGREWGGDMLSNKRVAALIQSARRLYDYVILDTPPCSLLADASEIAEYADCALVVIRQDFATRDQILDGVQSLAESGLPLMGCVFNCVRSSLSYGYGYGYGHGYGYGSGYGSGYGKSEP